MLQKISFRIFIVGIITLSSCTGFTNNNNTNTLITSYSLGDKNAKVTIEIYSDYQCPACAYFENNVFPSIQDQLINPGRVYYIFHDFPIHPDAWQASESVYCAGEQGKYWEMHRVLFENQQNLTPAAIKSYATQIGLNEDTFLTCFNSRKYQSHIQSLFEKGKAIGVQGTPTIVIDGNKIESTTVPSFEDIKKIVTALEQ